MDFDVIINMVVAKFPVVLDILQILGTLVVAGSAYVASTKNQKDDAKLAKIENHPIGGVALRLLVRSSLVQRNKK